jgi:triacylglycerol lipase
MSELKRALRALGREFTPEQIAATQALFAAVALKPTPDLCTVTRDLKYGPDERNRLDVFVPTAPADGARPVVAFIHGGGFLAGDKGGPDAPFHNHFGAWAAREGFVGVTVTYRLAPAHRWPSGVEDMAAAASFLKVNAERFGGDPSRIVFVGQSAGASHVASYLAHPDTRDAAAGTLAAAVLLSGVYDVARGERNPQNIAYYGEDASRFAGQSSLEGLAGTPVPLFLTVSELEPPPFQRQAAFAIERRVAVKDRWPAFRWLAGHNHLSPVLQIGSPEDDLGPVLADMIRGLDDGE